MKQRIKPREYGPIHGWLRDELNEKTITSLTDDVLISTLMQHWIGLTQAKFNRELQAIIGQGSSTSSTNLQVRGGLTLDAYMNLKTFSVIHHAIEEAAHGG